MRAIAMLGVLMVCILLIAPKANAVTTDPVSPSVIDFGDVQLGSTTSQTVVLRGAGDIFGPAASDVRFRYLVMLSSPVSAWFSLTNNTCNRAQATGVSECMFTLTFFAGQLGLLPKGTSLEGEAAATYGTGANAYSNVFPFNIAILANVTPVPLPASGVLLAGALALLLRQRRRTIAA